MLKLSPTNRAHVAESAGLTMTIAIAITIAITIATAI